MTKGELELNEPHPMAKKALAYVIANITPVMIESLASTALSGNRSADVCYQTWRRLESHQPVSDRYILGLAWLIKCLVEGDEIV